MCGGMAEEKEEQQSELSKKWETEGAREFEMPDVADDEEDDEEEEEADEDFDPLAMCGGMAEEKEQEQSELSKKWETVGAKEFEQPEVEEDEEEDDEEDEEADEEGDDFDPLAMCGGMAEEKEEVQSELSKKWEKEGPKELVQPDVEEEEDDE